MSEKRRRTADLSQKEEKHPIETGEVASGQILWSMLVAIVVAASAVYSMGSSRDKSSLIQREPASHVKR